MLKICLLWEWKKSRICWEGRKRPGLGPLAVNISLRSPSPNTGTHKYLFSNYSLKNFSSSTWVLIKHLTSVLLILHKRFKIKTKNKWTYPVWQARERRNDQCSLLWGVSAPTLGLLSQANAAMWLPARPEINDGVSFCHTRVKCQWHHQGTSLGLKHPLFSSHEHAGRMRWVKIAQTRLNLHKRWCIAL